jgi:hypothetical protein
MNDFVYSKTPRGFRLIEFKSHIHEGENSIQESSLADEACLWIGKDSERMHISRKQAREIAKILRYFSKTGYLPDEGDLK